MTIVLRNLARAALVAVATAVASATVVTGCDREPEQAPVVKTEVAAGTGAVAGVVRFDGAVPAPRLIAEADAAKCHPGAAPVYDESLVVDADGGLRNVVVYVQDGPNVPTPGSTPPVLDQAGCRYVPHVLAVRAGQPVTVRSSDPIQHNVHAAKPANNRAFSLPFVAAGEKRAVTFARAEASPPVEVRCDVHQWMRAYVAVFDHPFFAVTGDAGRFELRGLPAGTYTLVAWHERYGEKRIQVTIGGSTGAASAAPVAAEFRFGT
jgi:plastocyanin